MKVKLGAVLFLTALLGYGCGTFKPPWPTDSLRPVEPFQMVKSCNLEKDSKLLFFVLNPSENPETDIFTKKLIAGAKLQHETYGHVKIWLHYPEVSEANARTFPESLPSLIIIETQQGIKTINLKKKDGLENFYGLWKEFLTPNRLTFIENCVYGF